MRASSSGGCWSRSGRGRSTAIRAGEPACWTGSCWSSAAARARAAGGGHGGDPQPRAGDRRGPDLLAGRWSDSERGPALGRRRRRASSTTRSTTSTARPAPRRGDSTWAEWHYFNVVLDDDRWLYLTLTVGGRVGVPGEWGGRVLLTVRGRGRGPPRPHPRRPGRGGALRHQLRRPVAATVRGRVRAGGRGVPGARARRAGARVDLRVRPAPDRYFPPTDLGGDALVSGYVAPALSPRPPGRSACRAASGCAARAAYHDHNWGVWRGVVLGVGLRLRAPA